MAASIAISAGDPMCPGLLGSATIGRPSYGDYIKQDYGHKYLL